MINTKQHVYIWYFNHLVILLKLYLSEILTPLFCLHVNLTWSVNLGWAQFQKLSDQHHHSIGPLEASICR